MFDIDEDYEAFVDKFKPKKTTDDCYTPENVYQAIANWAVKEYDIDPEKIVRPFWPGGDYERFEYPPDCVVLDNPPFSIVSRICKMYAENDISFFLFAPYLTNFSINVKGVTHIITDAGITYENGAIVSTAFLTNLDGIYLARTAPELNAAIKEANAKNRREKVRQLPKYDYPDEVLTATMMGYIGKNGVDFRIKFEDGHFVRALDSQKAKGKTIFGAGYLLSEKAAAEKAAAEKAAAEKAAAEKWQLTEDEKRIVASLGKQERGETDEKERRAEVSGRCASASEGK